MAILRFIIHEDILSLSASRSWFENVQWSWWDVLISSSDRGRRRHRIHHLLSIRGHHHPQVTGREGWLRDSAGLLKWQTTLSLLMQSLVLNDYLVIAALAGAEVCTAIPTCILNGFLLCRRLCKLSLVTHQVVLLTTP